MRIGELARATGTSVETIRYYEREGIIPAADRADNNYRDYSPEHLATLTFVRRARGLGFSMAQVRALLALSADADTPCADVDRMVQSQIEEVDRRIGDLEAMRAQLSGMLAACGGRRIGDCGVVESLANRPPAN
ncbi:heavy metal-responsive transcriptional regulator [Pelagerythrobacter marinus]|uniref:MerR family DNA-binding protein n=1 Tax=Pelagerythrobacter marinus TaxID=538382 RepID=A0ABW9UWT6_9SPHN|nr:heavy metal-responsive transcriptional regulator [Pelagerythrobacter marinus]MXO68384.1 MerR family DNA-binding protein [Pelagerythrobacter marinus]USA40461.1 heavy metal-responsive transcriptional regulator [Pelagerythrobacter marinus]WPZ08369.1 heavy metal-responsive transcriptional regulator [Pelagerythrobacter marinus]